MYATLVEKQNNYFFLCGIYKMNSTELEESTAFINIPKNFPVVTSKKVLDKTKNYNRILHLAQIFAAEYIATSLLLFMVCMGCLDGLTNTPLSPIQSPLTSGIAVGILVQVFGHVSGAHMNPAVTVSLLTLGQIDFIATGVYFAAEMLGATTGYGMIVALIPSSIMEKNTAHCETNPHPEMSVVGACFFEFFITSLLIFLVCSITDLRNSDKQDSVSIKFALAVAGLSYAGGALTGASLNPARTFGPAVWHGSWYGHWAYWVGPMAAGFIATKLYQLMFVKDLSSTSSQ